MENKIQTMKIDQIKLNDQNPRFIRDHKFKKLVKSIKEFGKMMEIRPIVVDENMIILGGNMRFRACKAAGLKEIPVMVVSGLTDAEKNEFIVKDNVGFGEWDFDMLSNHFDHSELLEWGVDVPKFDESENEEIEEIDGESSKMPELGELQFSDELLLEHNYIVLYFDNPLDWNVAIEKFGLKQVKSGDPAEKCQKIGVGRVINGKNFI
jgi:hypothetical protein